MVRSMTGFGRGEAASAGFQATVEARSVNNRFCEVRLRLPRTLGAFENEAQSLVKSRMARGKIDVSVQVQQTDGAELGLSVNGSVARGYTQLLTELLRETQIDDKIRLTHLLGFSDIFDKEADEETTAEDAWKVVKEALALALDSLDKMRVQEGNALRTDLQARLDGLKVELVSVEERAPERIAENRERLVQRIGELFEDERVDPERLEVEIAILADRLDVSEEIVRLYSHFEQFGEAIASDEPIGRRLNFLTQEMNREVNTIGSKANDAQIATHVITMKELLEQIREQVSNVQ